MAYATKELSPETWPDFERLFAPGTGWAFCGCMLYQRGCHLPKAEYPNREAMRIQNQAEKRALVNGGRAHGILVYDDGEPIGWRQFGPAEELPRPGGGSRDRRIHPLCDGIRWHIAPYVLPGTPSPDQARMGVSQCLQLLRLASDTRRPFFATQPIDGIWFLNSSAQIQLPNR